MVIKASEDHTLYPKSEKNEKPLEIPQRERIKAAVKKTPGKKSETEAQEKSRIELGKKSTCAYP